MAPSLHLLQDRKGGVGDRTMLRHGRINHSVDSSSVIRLRIHRNYQLELSPFRCGDLALKRPASV